MKELLECGFLIILLSTLIKRCHVRVRTHHTATAMKVLLLKK
jgi:hypothetical protein